MYTQHFRLSEPPFSIAPNPRYLYLSPHHREALAHLLYGIGVGGGFVVLTGEVGTGKTTLCRALLDQLPPDVEIALVFNPRLSSRELLAGICDELHIPDASPKRTLKQLIDGLNHHLLEAHARGRRVIVLIDEAQNLRFDVLEQVRLLTNLETNQAKLLQIILVGQPELNALLDRPNLRQLAQRITARYHLNPLSLAESGDYIQYRMTVAGGSERCFSGPAVRVIHRQSGGIPRLINLIADRALLGAYTLGRSKVTAHIARQAGLELMARRRRPTVRIGWLAGLVGMAAAVWVAYGHLETLMSIAPEHLRMQFFALTEGEWPPRPEKVPLQPDSARAAPEGPVERKDDMTGAELRVSQPSPVPVPSGPRAFPGWIGRPETGGRDGAFASLLTLWSANLPPAVGDPCAWVASHGLRCQILRGAWSQIQSLELPMVLDFVMQGGVRRHAALIGRHDGQLLLSNGGQTEAFGLDEVLPWWSGQATAIWKPGLPETAYVKPGAESPVIGDVRRQLGVTTAPGAENRYDERLQARILEFQASRGITADGVVGSLTLFHLQSASADPAIPRLRTEPGLP